MRLSREPEDDLRVRTTPALVGSMLADECAKNIPCKRDVFCLVLEKLFKGGFAPEIELAQAFVDQIFGFVDVHHLVENEFVDHFGTDLRFGAYGTVGGETHGA